jgi:hypothetical protein
MAKWVSGTATRPKRFLPGPIASSLVLESTKQAILGLPPKPTLTPHGMACFNETGEGMAILEMVLASLILLFPAWLIWRAFSTSRQLELRLAQGDASLLSDDRFSIDRVTLGPPGTQLIEDVQFVAVQPIVSAFPPQTNEIQPPQGEV